MKKSMKKVQLTIPALVAALMISGTALAEGSIQRFGQSTSQLGQSASHIGQSVSHSARATGNLVVGTSQVVAGVAAVPFKAIGAVGDVGHAAGDLLWDAATGSESEALEISDETVTAGPAPMMAINNQ